MVRSFAWFALVLALTHTAQAESPYSPRRAARLLLAGSLHLQSPAAIAEDPALVALRGQLRAARIWMTVGAGLLLGGIVHAAMLGNRHTCSEPGQRLVGPPIAGGITAGLGFSFVLSSGLKLARTPEGLRRQTRASPGMRTAMAAGGFGVATVSAAALFSMFAGQWIDCISS